MRIFEENADSSSEAAKIQKEPPALVMLQNTEIQSNGNT